MAVQLYAWGANSHGQLGLGYQSEQVIHPERIDLSKSNINPIDIKCIIGGAGHTLILSHSGRLFGCGWNKKGQVGVPINSEIISSIREIDMLNTEKIIDIVCGWDSSLALTENGEIYGWGSNYYGQLGFKNLSHDNLSYNISSIKNTYNPTKILIDVKVKRIAMGLRHSALVSDDGRVFVSGSGTKCQLGIVDSDNKPISSIDTFIPVPGIENVVDVACGQYFTMALTDNSDIFIWGNNKYGQIGVDYNEIISSITPIKLNYNCGKIKKISAGWTHANILNSDGAIFSWGRDTYGQLGNYIDDTYMKWQPRVVGSISNICQMSTGSEHIVSLNDKGRIYSWGWNEHGNCGNGNVENVFSPCEIFDCNMNIGLIIGSGAAHSFAIVKRIIEFK